MSQNSRTRNPVARVIVEHGEFIDGFLDPEWLIQQAEADGDDFPEWGQR